MHEPIRESWSYSGEVWTGGDRRAVVVLPAFVRSHRTGFDYELVPIVANCSARVLEAIAGDRFVIETNVPHAKVAWRVTALREQSR